jgi:glycosyltransferase involved in cell wall biosynthesis
LFNGVQKIMVNNTVLTIGLCAKDSEKTISLALESLSNQDYPHELMEIIFVDDGSRDCTLDLFKAFAKGTDIRTQIFSGPWRGLGVVRNTVLNNARGEFVLWVDSDEILTPSFVRKQVDLITRNPRVGIVVGQLGFLPDENPVLVLDLIPYVLISLKRDWKYPSKVPGTGCTLFRLVAAKQLGGFNEKITGTGEDIELIGRMMHAGWEVMQGRAVFFESHGKMVTLKQLWNKYLNDGFHGRRLYATNKYFSFLRINPLASFLVGILYFPLAWKVTERKVVVLLPFHFLFKMTAWFFGFCKTKK